MGLSKNGLVQLISLISAKNSRPNLIQTSDIMMEAISLSAYSMSVKKVVSRCFGRW